jgi:phosphoglycerate dehydrogenase-like enzyme
MNRVIFAIAAVFLSSFLVSAQDKKILVTGIAATIIPELQSIAPNTKFEVIEPNRFMQQAVDADAIVGTIAPVSPELLHVAKKLKWVHSYGAGVEKFMNPEFVKSDVILTNGKIVQGPEIADHALALLLSLTRDLYRVIPKRTSEQWGKGGFQAIELRGKTAVVIGVGGIGSQIAQRAAAFGMTVIGVDPKDMPLNPNVSRFVSPDQLDSVLPSADVVFVSAPHTPRSEGMMGRRQFELMKKNSYFIAVSRGKLYNTEALVKALDEKRLAGAGLDVTDPEPLPAGHPLWKFENVVITPHVATVSDGIAGRMRELTLDNVARFTKGQPLRNVVDKQKGY